MVLWGCRVWGDAGFGDGASQIAPPPQPSHSTNQQAIHTFPRRSQNRGSPPDRRRDPPQKSNPPEALVRPTGRRERAITLPPQGRWSLSPRRTSRPTNFIEQPTLRLSCHQAKNRTQASRRRQGAPKRLTLWPRVQGSPGRFWLLFVDKKSDPPGGRQGYTSSVRTSLRKATKKPPPTPTRNGATEQKQNTPTPLRQSKSPDTFPRKNISTFRQKINKLQINRLLAGEPKMRPPIAFAGCFGEKAATPTRPNGLRLPRQQDT